MENKMKALVYYGIQDLRYQDVPIPEIGDDEVLLKVKAVSICGSDITGYIRGSNMRIGPLIMGHEFSGEVVKIGTKVEGFALGDRCGAQPSIHCNNCQNCADGLTNDCDYRFNIGATMPIAGNWDGAMAEYVRVPAWRLLKLPDHISYDEAAFLEPMGVALHATNRAEMFAGSLKGKTVLVYGAGPIGLFIVQCLRTKGCERIIVAEVLEKRREMAVPCGATHLINPEEENVYEITRKMTNGVGVDVVFDAVGTPETINDGGFCVRNAGVVIMTGHARPRFELEFKNAIINELVFTGSHTYITEMEDALVLMSEGKVDVKPLITGSYVLEDGVRIFEDLCSGKTKEIIIVMHPND